MKALITIDYEKGFILPAKEAGELLTLLGKAQFVKWDGYGVDSAKAMTPILPPSQSLLIRLLPDDPIEPGKAEAL